MAKDVTLQRKLAAIVAADVVGYSRLMEADEAGTLRAVQRLKKACVEPAMAAHGGRLIKTTGDGFLLEFASAVAAVLFALDLQKTVRASMAATAEEKRIVLRIGIHAGDVLSDGVDMFGDGVNVAARLETLCAPGGIAMSAVVQEQLQGKVAVPLVDLGPHQVKNITRAIHVFGIDATAIGSVATTGLGGVTSMLKRPQWRLHIAFAAAAIVVLALAGTAIRHHLISGRDKGAPTAPATFSIAVLPFTSLSTAGKPDDFADALVDNLTTELSIGLPTSSVIASASTFTYRGKAIDPRRVGEELGARYLLFGSVQRFSDRLRVNVQLVDSHSAAQLWSDTFDGALADIGALQDQITSGIANTLAVQLVRIEAERQKYTTNASALDLIFRGAATLNRGPTAENLNAAEADYRRALVVAPNNPMAMKMLAVLLVSKSTLHLYKPDDKDRADFNEALTLLDAVRAQDARYPGLNSALGFAALAQDRHRQAIAFFKSEIEIDPSSTSALSGLALCLIGDGRSGEAIPLIEKSMRLDPHSSAMFGYNQTLMLAHFALGDYPKAIEQGELAYNANPNAPDIAFYLASAYALAGDAAEAKAKLVEALKHDPHRTVRGMRANIAATEPSEIALATRYIEGLKRAGLPE